MRLLLGWSGVSQPPTWWFFGPYFTLSELSVGCCCLRSHTVSVRPLLSLALSPLSCLSTSCPTSPLPPHPSLSPLPPSLSLRVPPRPLLAPLCASVRVCVTLSSPSPQYCRAPVLPVCIAVCARACLCHPLSTLSPVPRLLACHSEKAALRLSPSRIFLLNLFYPLSLSYWFLWGSQPLPVGWCVSWRPAIESGGVPSKACLVPKQHA